MIVVSGSMRSGTSLWMQILRAAGLPVIGDAFPEHWPQEFRIANPGGFFESRLTAGVYHATNPCPESGAFLSPTATRTHAVKVFVPGLVRSDLAYLDRVIVTVRAWREVASSHRTMAAIHARLPALDLCPALLWWSETFAAIRDIAIRGYPAHVVAYSRLLGNPASEVTDVLDWLGIGGLDVDAAAACIRPELRRSRPTRDVDVSLSPRQIEVLDELYEHLEHAVPMTVAFISKLNALDAEVTPTLRAAQSAFDAQTRRQSQHAHTDTFRTHPSRSTTSTV
ncbi:MAG: hypothetical protein H6697_07510 [Myxococcales bacterium]|nr:hypothetical protein [Myxococcales bacterium]